MTTNQWLAASPVAALSIAPAAAQRADVIHFYTSSGESLAIGVFAKVTTSAVEDRSMTLRSGRRRNPLWQ